MRWGSTLQRIWFFFEIHLIHFFGGIYTTYAICIFGRTGSLLRIFASGCEVSNSIYSGNTMFIDNYCLFFSTHVPWMIFVVANLFVPLPSIREVHAICTDVLSLESY